MQGWLLWFALTAAFSLMGVGMASWQSGMEVGGALTTAYIGVEFSDSNGANIITNPPDSWQGAEATASINRIDSKNIELVINNAYPGLKVNFWYQIKNTGTLPLRMANAPVINLPNGISEYQTNAQPDPIGVEGSGNGELFILVNEDATPESEYRFTMKITYEPNL